MEYNRPPRPCWNGMNCDFLKMGKNCKFYHPQQHRDIVAREQGSQRNISSQLMTNMQPQNYGTGITRQYPNDPTAYRINQGYDRSAARHNNDRPSQNYQKNSNYRNPNDKRRHNKNRPSNQKARNFQQETHYQKNSRNDNSDRDRSRDLMNPRNLNRPQYHDTSPDHTYSGRNLRKEGRRSLEYITKKSNKDQSKKQNNQYYGNYPSVKPEKNEIKMNFGYQKVQKIQEQSRSDNNFNYQPSMQNKNKLPGLFNQQNPRNYLQNYCSVANQVRNRVQSQQEQRRINLQRRRARQLREMRLRPNQARYFYNNWRLIEENRRMNDENRIQQQERQRMDREFPSYNDVYRPRESVATRQYGARQYAFEIQNDPFIAEDDYGIDDGQTQVFYEDDIAIENENLVTEQNFHWFIRHCKFIDGRTLTFQEASQLQVCVICLQKFNDLVLQENVEKMQQMDLQKEEKPQKQNHQKQNKLKNNDHSMLIQLYCHQKHVLHKQCGLQWLQVQLKSYDNIGHKSQCPRCKKDFRDHPAFSKYDPKYRERFVQFSQLNNDQDQFQYEDFNMVNWQQEMTRLHNRGRDPILRLQRIRNVIIMYEEMQRQWPERQQRRRERRRRRREDRDRERYERELDRRMQDEKLERPQQEEQPKRHSLSSKDSSYYPQLEERLYPRQIESGTDEREEENRSRQDINPEADRQYWEKVWEQESLSNPFNEEQNESPSSHSQNDQ